MSDRKDSAEKRLGASTMVLTRGYDPRLSLGSARPAVFRSSTYVFPTPEAAERAFSVATGRSRQAEGEDVGLIYARINHPNAEILEDQIVPLESGAEAAAVFNSGMAAIMTALVTFARPGDSIVYTVPLYGGTQHLIHQFLEPIGIKGFPVPAGHTKHLEDLICTVPNLRIVLVETPANPTLRMSDIGLAAQKAHERDPHALVMVDNTFLGPAFQHPLMVGADLVLYSATKYLSGFSDLLAGAALARDTALIEQMKASRIMFGNILPPDECWLLDSRLPTVMLRMNRASKNAQRIAERLARHAKVRRVLYPTLFTDPEQIRIRDAQCEFPGGILSLDLGSKAAAFDFLRHLQIGRNAVSLGGVETLVCHPKTTTHSPLPVEELEAAGVTDGLVRVSVGIEDWKDLLDDFQQALDKL
ncbi:MAG: cystathionine gamma-synthase [Acidimicrobiia bacterium]|nr:cystathionine gamma-synthase [Acidimicrobiia bacterium]